MRKIAPIFIALSLSTSQADAQNTNCPKLENVLPCDPSDIFCELSALQDDATPCDIDDPYEVVAKMIESRREIDWQKRLAKIRENQQRYKTLISEHDERIERAYAQAAADANITQIQSMLKMAAFGYKLFVKFHELAADEKSELNRKINRKPAGKEFDEETHNKIINFHYLTHQYSQLTPEELERNVDGYLSLTYGDLFEAQLQKLSLEISSLMAPTEFEEFAEAYLEAKEVFDFVGELTKDPGVTVLKLALKPANVDPISEIGTVENFLETSRIYEETRYRRYSDRLSKYESEISPVLNPPILDLNLGSKCGATKCHQLKQAPH